MKRTLSLLLVAMFVLVAIGSAAAQEATAPAPGELVDVGGRSIHLLCAGEGSPTVVLEAGLGDGSINFRSLQRRLALVTRTCAYDRAGYGWSDPGPEPRDLEGVVTDLRATLDGAGEVGPYVMAGHSIGGLFALGFTHAYPDDVVGVVLIDSSHPEQMEELRAVPELLDVQDMEIEGLAGVIEMAENGELPPQLVRQNAPPVLQPELQDEWARLFVQPKQLRAAVAEYAALDATLVQANAAMDLGDVPVIVLSRGVGLDGQLPPATLEAFGLTADVIARSEAIWSSLQENLLSVSTDAKRAIAERATHYIYYGQPALVEAAIRELVREAR